MQPLQLQFQEFLVLNSPGQVIPLCDSALLKDPAAILVAIFFEVMVRKAEYFTFDKASIQNKQIMGKLGCIKKGSVNFF
ncbi:hypothetical protein QNH39_18395 [Neobacillus novalis]|uniref:Uncharacterized protein n=1 Tax=Neobacillus novalis TaxID=220687 RepID=A0AA95MWW5_9BACI|nr:hypothetical protein [Neobacillus novalis]WHY89168.1 hypothetical protein QNH39_18395 [Neobacillus novalis]